MSDEADRQDELRRPRSECRAPIVVCASRSAATICTPPHARMSDAHDGDGRGEDVRDAARRSRPE